MRRAMETIRVARRIASWLVALQIPLLAAFPRPDGYVNVGGRLAVAGEIAVGAIIGLGVPVAIAVVVASALQ
jgi:hypothetical protein